MKIYLATDHAGYDLKEDVKEFLLDNEYQVEDLGALKYDQNDDYPNFISLAAKAVSKYQEDRAIIFGGSGQGEAMVANRFKGVRATVYYGGSKKIITLSREHNNANVLSIGARFLSASKAKKVIKLWLETNFTNQERHARRIQKLDELTG